MVVFPNAKINIGLNIIEKLRNGYHAIESCFYPIPLTDVLEVIKSDALTFSSSGVEIPGNKKGNLCLKAYHLIQSEFDIPPVAIHLHKHIPVGAGLGGGSSDGAFMIKMLNEKFELGISIKKMKKFASQLGSDCPFFIKNEAVFVEGAGNVFNRFEFTLKGKYLVLIMPDIHVSTGQAYAKVSPQKPVTNLKADLEKTDLSKLYSIVKNDFESSVFKQFPELSKIKESLLKNGADYASMSGSGSAVYGVFENKPKFTSTHSFKIFHL